MDTKKISFTYTSLASALVVLCIAQPTYATTVPSANSADPGRIIKRTLTPPPSFASTERQKEVSMMQPKESVVGHVQPFIMKHVVITGNTALSSSELSSSYSDMIGKRVTSDMLYSIANRITSVYMNAGYPLVTTRVSVKGNKAIFHVSEGRVGEVLVEGVMNPSTAQYLQGLGNKLKMHSPLNMEALERYALLANDTPGMNIKTVVRPSKTDPNAMDIVFIGCYKPFEAYLSFDNRGTKILGPEEWLAGGFANSWWGGNRTGIEGLVTHDFKQERYVSLTHQQYIGSEGFNLFFELGQVETYPGGEYFDVGTKGWSSFASVTASYPIIRSRQHSLFVHGTFDMLNSHQKERSINYLLFDDKIRSVRVGATYDFRDRWRATNIIDVEVSHGIDGLGASSVTSSNPGGDLDYTKFTASYNRTQYLTSNISYQLGIFGQYSGDTLLTSEQFGFGGPVYGRGYDPSELLGDYGIEGKLELRYDWYPAFSAMQNYFNYIQWYALYDAGTVWNRGTASYLSDDSATSVGVGARFDIIPDFLTGNIEVDKPLTHTVYLEGNKDVRWYFGLTASV